MGLPIVGYLPFLTKKPYAKLTELKNKYGPIFRIFMGSQEIIVLCDFKIIKEAFALDAFMGRPSNSAFELTETSTKTGAFHDLPWKEQRRFSLSMLRDLGFGKSQMEVHMKEEAEELLERMTACTKTPVKMAKLLTPSMSNNIASFLFGKRLKYNDPTRQRTDQNLSDVGKLTGALVVKQFFPWLGPIMKFFNIGNPKKFSEATGDMKKYVREQINEHEKTLDSNNIRDFIDGYLLEIKKRSNDPNSTFKKDVLLDLSQGFFGAGSETVRITVDWMLLICVAFPEVQKKIHQEIDTVLDTERFPSYQDRFNMPYTEAAICELMRWKTIIPMNFMRYTLKDTELNGYFIPKHSRVLAVLYSIDHDESLWGNDVDVYRPERFLSENGKKVVKPEHFIPFSIGKRSCPGKPLAEIEIFTYLTAILQKFEFSLPPGKEADLEGNLGIGLQPKSQELCLKLRH
ncbi:hypothetical protein JTE90_007392 [Oedothorax gibbosus]|uniref:Cytochrome P450 n=1 Tax=Oedothorax gibbosus TaxID=931172 RepID=A0AAV6TVK7_9ARAC|nr:hypothetical protein JTE90_007392 [Oedothorax gibbosus]